MCVCVCEVAGACILTELLDVMIGEQMNVE